MRPPLHPPLMSAVRAAGDGFLGKDGSNEGTPGVSAPGTTADKRLRAAVSAAYSAHQGLVYRLALRYGYGRAEFADDVTQEVFLQLWKHAHALSDLDAIEGWLYQATTRRCLNKLRNEKLVGILTLRWLRTDTEPSLDPHTLHGAREELRRAFQALSELPPRERIAFSMYHLDGKSQDEIGEILGHNKSYVCKLIKRAGEKLAKLGWELEP